MPIHKKTGKYSAEKPLGEASLYRQQSRIVSTQPRPICDIGQRNGHVRLARLPAVRRRLTRRPELRGQVTFCRICSLRSRLSVTSCQFVIPGGSLRSVTIIARARSSKSLRVTVAKAPRIGSSVALSGKALKTAGLQQSLKTANAACSRCSVTSKFEHTNNVVGDGSD